MEAMPRPIVRTAAVVTVKPRSIPSSAPVPEPSPETVPETVPLAMPVPDSPVPAPESVPEPSVVVPVPVAAVGSLFDEPGFETPPVPASERLGVLETAAAEVARCKRCPHLAVTRTQTVYGAGTPTARLMFIGEAPGADEDRLGQPFVGRAGQLLTDMITKGMGLRREDVYIANVLKCRPPNNRPPTPEEAANCSSYLDHQVAVVRPEFLCLLGKTAAVGILGVDPMISLGRLRGRWHRHRGIKTLVTYHPSYLLRTPSAKKDAWEDLQVLMKEMGLAIPGRKRGASE